MAFVVPSLSFNGNCEEAFNFYKSVFGGEFQQFMRWKDMPSDEKITGEAGEKVMHIALPIGKDTVIMGGDRLATMGDVTNGNNFDIAIIAESEEEAKRLFDGLSAGGKIGMPLEKAFWGAYFGMFTDKFGIQWMVNYDYKK
jgi:PhnB protein